MKVNLKDYKVHVVLFLTFEGFRLKQHGITSETCINRARCRSALVAKLPNWKWLIPARIIQWKIQTDARVHRPRIKASEFEWSALKVNVNDLQCKFEWVENNNKENYANSSAWRRTGSAIWFNLQKVYDSDQRQEGWKLNWKWLAGALSRIN